MRSIDPNSKSYLPVFAGNHLLLDRQIVNRTDGAVNDETYRNEKVVLALWLQPIVSTRNGRQVCNHD